MEVVERDRFALEVEERNQGAENWEEGDIQEKIVEAKAVEVGVKMVMGEVEEEQ